jgi:hypothetical protein
MKIKLFVLVTISVSSLSQANDVVSPDGRYAVRAEETITLIDVNSGQTLLVLSKNTAGATRVEVAWAPDSRKVAMVEDWPHGSAVFGAWADSLQQRLLNQTFSAHPNEVPTWHKTLQADADESAMIHQAEQEFGGRLVSENRVFAGWVSPDAIKVKGEMHFSSRKRCAYTYTLHFMTNVAGHLDKGGYEEGVIVGRDLRLL